MNRKVSILIIAILIFQTGYAQLSIEDCYEKAQANYPLIKQYGLIDKSKEYNLSNASKGYLPQIQFSAKASYQSKVTEIPIDIPGVKGLSKDQYGMTVDINQNIWDGGDIKARKENIRTQSDVNKKNVEVTLYAIRDRVNQLFFGILLYDEMLKQNDLYQNDLKRSYTQITAYMENGIANKADLDAIEVEQIKTIQNRTELIHNRSAYIEMLSALIGESITQNTSLTKPDVDQLNSSENKRPELTYYDAQIKNLDAQRAEINAGIMPKLAVFATGGYGRPSLNMLENKFSPYYIGGVSLSWNLSSLYTKKNKINNIEANKGMIEAQRETFLFNNKLDITQNDNEIKKMRELLKTDDDIIRLHGSVKMSAEAKVSNGTLSVLELMKEVNAEQQAVQNKIVHQIQFIQAIYNLKYITNN